jgi:hypothetical protein
MKSINISPEAPKKYSWFWIGFGIIGMTLFAFLTFIAARDTMNFSKQGSPQLTDVEKLESDGTFERKWVTLKNFKLDCKTVEQTIRTNFLERLILGKVYDTYMVIPNNSGKAVIVAIFHGDVSCQNVQNKPLTGILTTTTDYSYGVAFLSTGLSKTTQARFILRVDEGLSQSRNLLALGIFFDIVFLSFIVNAVRQLLTKPKP